MIICSQTADSHGTQINFYPYKLRNCYLQSDGRFTWDSDHVYESLESLVLEHSLLANGMVTLLTDGCPVRYFIVQDSLFPGHQVLCRINSFRYCAGLTFSWTSGIVRDSLFLGHQVLCRILFFLQIRYCAGFTLSGIVQDSLFLDIEATVGGPGVKKRVRLF